ncbi:hypothetical protein P692DRAFT_20830049 [Suillus brevipes Sb2]|nr:hypothetical protein P692DRAFT_20830049 [Suillus brevipes Sb2]
MSWRTLPPSVYSILNSTEPLPVSLDSPEEPFFDHEYYKSFSSVLSGFGAAAKDTYGFNARPEDTERPKTPRRESAKIQTASKISGFTLTHLAHAALAMVVIAYNPPNPASSSHLELYRDVLLRVAEIAKGQYRAHKELPAGLSTMPQVDQVYASANEAYEGGTPWLLVVQDMIEWVLSMVGAQLEVEIKRAVSPV